MGYPVSKEHIQKTFSNPDNDPRGPWTTSDLSANHKGPYFEIKNPANGDSFFPPEGRYWVFNEQEVLRRIADGRIIFGKSGIARPVQKVFLSGRKYSKTRAESWWDNNGMNEDATSELKEILGVAKVFTHPKPSELLYHILKISTETNSIILDFFAGSGTAMDATLKLNNEDNGTRQCILVQINDQEVCENVTYERNRRVMQGYTNSKGEAVPGLGNSLKYYRTAFVGKNPPRRALDSDRLELACKAGNLLALAENTLFERERTEAFQIFTDDADPQNVTAIYFLEDIGRLDDFQARVEALAEQAGKVAVYIFSWDDGAVYDTMFEMCRNVEIKSIPQPILEIYQTLQ